MTPWATAAQLDQVIGSDNTNGVRITDPAYECAWGNQPGAMPWPHEAMFIESSIGNRRQTVDVSPGQPFTWSVVTAAPTDLWLAWAYLGRPCAHESFPLPGATPGACMAFLPGVLPSSSSTCMSSVGNLQVPNIVIPITRSSSASKGVVVDPFTLQVFTTNLVTAHVN